MKNPKFNFLIIFLLGLTLFFFFHWVDSAVSEKYEVFEPTESYYYSSLKTPEEGTKYNKEISKHNLHIHSSELINKQFLTGFGLLVIKKHFVK